MKNLSMHFSIHTDDDVYIPFTHDQDWYGQNEIHFKSNTKGQALLHVAPKKIWEISFCQNIRINF